MNKLLFDCLVKVSKIIISKDKEKCKIILKLILSFASDFNYSSKNSELCIKLIQNLCEDFGEKYTENYLLPQLIFYSQDKRDDIRKEVLLTIPNICEVISSEKINTSIYEIIKNYQMIQYGELDNVL